MKGRPYNVGLSDANLSKRELCERIQEHLPSFVFIESAIGEIPTSATTSSRTRRSNAPAIVRRIPWTTGYGS